MKFQKLEAFHASQGNCKECFNHKRALGRIAGTQNCSEELSSLQQDVKQGDALLKSFVKAREKAKTNGQKLKFSIMVFSMEWKSRSGLRREQEGEMMWEGEYIEWSATAPAGYLSKTEAEANWKKWKDDPLHPHDEAGPRGYLRLYIKTKTLVKAFEETSQDKSFRKEDRLGKKASEEQIRQRMRSVLDSSCDGQMADSEVGSFSDVMQRAHRAFGAAGHDTGAAFDSGIAGDIDVSELLTATRSKLKRKRPADNDGEDEEKDDDDQDGKDGAAGEPPTPEKVWLDETKVRKAQRTYMNGVDTLVQSMEETKQLMTEALAVTRRSSEGAKDSPFETIHSHKPFFMFVLRRGSFRTMHSHPSPV